MRRPKLSYYVRYDGRLRRLRIRRKVQLGELIDIGTMAWRLRAMGWEGDRFVLHYKAAWCPCGGRDRPVCDFKRDPLPRLVEHVRVAIAEAEARAEQAERALKAIADPRPPDDLGEPLSRLLLAREIARRALQPDRREEE